MMSVGLLGSRVVILTAALFLRLKSSIVIIVTKVTENIRVTPGCAEITISKQSSYDHDLR
jgi:hypothetical protein